MDAEQIDGTAVEDPSTDIVPHVEPHSQTLFRTDEPEEVIRRATAAADALKKVIEQKGMVQNIKGREHVLVSGWQTLGSMLGVVPVVVWTRPLDNGWEARVEARTLDGRTVGAAEAMCTREESTWKKRDDFALRSMAQTRATSKALRGPLGFVVTLAGYSDTPAEEMPPDPLQERYPGKRVEDVEVVGGSDIPSEDPETLTADQYAGLQAAFKVVGNPQAFLEAWLDTNQVPQFPHLRDRMAQLTPQQADALLVELRGQV